MIFIHHVWCYINHVNQELVATNQSFHSFIYDVHVFCCSFDMGASTYNSWFVIVFYQTSRFVIRAVWCSVCFVAGESLRLRESVDVDLRIRQMQKMTRCGHLRLRVPLYFGFEHVAAAFIFKPLICLLHDIRKIFRPCILYIYFFVLWFFRWS